MDHATRTAAERAARRRRPRPEPRVVVSWVVGLLVVGMVLAVMVATGPFRKGQPYYGRDLPPGERASVGRWTFGFDRAYLKRDDHRLTGEYLVVEGSAWFDGDRTSFAPSHGILVVVFGDEALTLTDCSSLPIGGQFQPRVLTGMRCEIALDDEGLLLPPGDLPLKVVMLGEKEGTSFSGGEKWEPTQPEYHVSLVAKDGRAHE